MLLENIYNTVSLMIIFLKYRPQDTTAYSFTIVSSRASLIDSLVTVFPVKERDKICDKTRYVTFEEQIIAPDDVWMVNMKLVVLSTAFDLNHLINESLYNKKFYGRN